MLHERYSGQGLTILGFPCNQFRVQEPGSNFEVAASVAPDGEFPHQPYQFLAKGTVNDEPILCTPGGPDGSCNRGETRCISTQMVHCMPTSTRCCAANNGVYDFLKQALPGELDWNFAKFLVGRDGRPISRYLSVVNPLNAGLVADIQAALGAKNPFANSTAANRTTAA